jgi:DNA-binding MarR family transcriptional regulator
MDPMTSPEEISRITAALAEIRRRQQSGRLGRAAGADAATGALFRALDALEAGPLSVTELAMRVGVDQPRASRLAAEAVRRGFATRQADGADARRTLVRLAAPGHRMLAHGHANRRAAVSTALSGFDQAEAQQFAALLERFLADWPD